MMPTRYVVLAADNRAAAFYSSDLHAPSQVPPAAIDISETLYQQWITNTAGLVYQSGALVAYVPPPPTATQLITYTNAKAQTLLNKARSYTAAGVTIMIDASQGTRTDLGDLAQWGAANTAAAQAWVDDNNTVTSVTGAQYVALAPLVGAYALSIYAVLASALTAIQATSPTITTTAQIDALAWPT
jgi:hypothetical protein